MNTNLLLLFCIFSSYFTIFFIGFLLGKNNTQVISKELFLEKSQRKSKDYEKVVEKMQKITIDDSKFVSNIDISDMEKKYDNIAPSVEINDNIDASVNKLSSLIKGK